MQTRYMEKRALDPTSSDEGQPDRKRPALASVIVEALKVDSLQKLCSSLEPILRRVVSEEVERALAKLGPAKLNARVSPKRIEGPDGRNLQLQFRSKLSLPLFTGGKVEGEQGSAIHIVLIDGNTNHVVTSGPESSVKLDLVVLEGDFNNEDDDGWTQEEFESHIVKEREGKRPLLTGELQVILKEGVGTLGELTFTDNSSWIRSRKFRLGLKVASGCCEGIRIREAKTDAFTVKDHRGELYKKHYPPALDDEVWRLEKIGKDGSFHKRLNKAGIHKVEDFLRLVVRDSQRLRNVLGSGMSNKMWEALVDHAKTCVLSGKLYVYYPDDIRNVGVVFNNIYELCGLISGGQYHSMDSLSDNQKAIVRRIQTAEFAELMDTEISLRRQLCAFKVAYYDIVFFNNPFEHAQIKYLQVYVDTLVKKAYDNWMHVVEYDGKSLLSLGQNKASVSSQNDLTIGSHNHSTSFDQQINLASRPASISSEQPALNSGLNMGGYNDSISSRYTMQPQNMNLNGNVQLNGASFHSQNHLLDTSQQAHPHGSDSMLALRPPQPSMSSYFAASTPNPYKGAEDYLTEEEIRMRSHEMLENEDMQHLLRIFNMGQGHASSSVAEENYQYGSYMPNMSSTFGFDEDRSRSSGKAVVGWLKLKAALRWGIFIRKKAAERRAQIVELDDS